MKANKCSRSTESDNNSSPFGIPGNPKNCSTSGKAKVNKRFSENMTYSTYVIKTVDKEEVPANPSTAQSNETRPPEDLHWLSLKKEEVLSCYSSEMSEGGNNEAENSRSSRNDPNKDIRGGWNRSLLTRRRSSPFNTINCSNRKSTDSGSFNLEGTDSNNVTSGSRSKKYFPFHLSDIVQQLPQEKTVTEKQVQAKSLEQDAQINKLTQINSNNTKQINELKQKTSDAEATKQKFAKVIKESIIILNALTDDLKRKNSSTWTDLSSWPFIYLTKKKCDEYNIIMKIESVCDTVKIFDTKFNRQQQKIENQESQIKSLNVELQDTRDKCKHIEEHFNEKFVKQKNIFMKTNYELGEAKREQQKEIEYLKETINKLNSEIKHAEEASKTLNNTLTFKQKELRGVNDPYKDIRHTRNFFNSLLSRTRGNSPLKSINSLNSKSTDSSSCSLEGTDLSTVTSGSKSRENIGCCPDIEQLEKQLQAKILEQEEEINTLSEINSKNIGHISQLEAITEHLRKLIEEGDAKLEVFTNDLEKGKSSTWIAYLMRRFTYENKKIIGEYNIVDKTKPVGDTVENVDTKSNHQQQKTEDQKLQIENLNIKLEDARDECKRTEEKFNEKFVSHTKILKEKDDELEDTKREHQKEINSLKETINKSNSKTKYAENISKTLNDKLISKEEELRGASDKILLLEEENSNIEQKLEQNGHQLERLREKTSDLDLQVHQTKEEAEKFKQKLNDVNVSLRKQVIILKREEEKFKNSLENISDKMRNHQKIISIDESAVQAEKHVINKALEMIRKVKEDVEDIEDQIHLFSGNSENKTFITLKDFLVRTISKLYGVESKGKEEILGARKECVTYVAALLIELESKVGK